MTEVGAEERGPDLIAGLNLSDNHPAIGQSDELRRAYSLHRHYYPGRTHAERPRVAHSGLRACVVPEADVANLRNMLICRERILGGSNAL